MYDSGDSTGQWRKELFPCIMMENLVAHISKIRNWILILYPIKNESHIYQ